MQVGKREDLFRGLPAQPAGIPGTKLKLSRQRALGLGFGWLRGWINFALAGWKRAGGIAAVFDRNLAAAFHHGLAIFENSDRAYGDRLGIQENGSGKKQ